VTNSEHMLTFELYGELGEKYGRTFNLRCSSVRQGLDILAANFKDFRQHLIDSDTWLQGYEVWVGDYNLDATESDFTMSHSGQTVKIIPVVKGASANARIVLGVILVVVGV